jgi:hypothetical protein
MNKQFNLINIPVDKVTLQDQCGQISHVYPPGQGKLFELEPPVERRVKERSRGTVPWYARYERRNRQHDYSAS